jgi:hypothetical protein
MKYKILKGTELFKNLTAFKKKMADVRKQAMDLAIELGGVSSASNGRYLAGGIDAVEFKEKPEGWRSVGNSWQNLYYPKADKKNKEIHNKIQALPRLDFDELNALVGFTGQFCSDERGIAHVKSVSIKWHKDFILMETAEGTEYTPVKDVIEILGSEYDTLSNSIKD